MEIENSEDFEDLLQNDFTKCSDFDKRYVHSMPPIANVDGLPSDANLDNLPCDPDLDVQNIEYQSQGLSQDKYKSKHVELVRVQPTSTENVRRDFK